MNEMLKRITALALVLVLALRGIAQGYSPPRT